MGVVGLIDWVRDGARSFVQDVVRECRAQMERCGMR